MKHFNDGEVIYLEGKDFNGDEFVYKGKFISLIQSLNCGWCTKVKPDYSNAAKKHKGVWTTIEMDTADEKLKSFVQNMPQFEGFPHIVLFKDGKVVKTYTGDRSSDDLIQFLENN